MSVSAHRSLSWTGSLLALPTRPAPAATPKTAGPCASLSAILENFVERGEKDLIQGLRRRFQQTMAEALKATVVQATGREVRVFPSETNIEADISVEIVFLGRPREDISACEE
jgi:hypothetical protein